MISELKKKYSARIGILGVLLLLVGTGIFVAIFSDYIFGGSNAIDLNEVSTSEIKPGKAKMYVGYVHGFYMYYGDEDVSDYTDFKNVTYMDFLVPVGTEDAWIGVRLSGKDMKAAVNNYQALLDLEDENGNVDYDALYERIEFIELEGTLKEMDRDARRYYNEYLDYYDMTAQERENFLEYVFVPNKVGGSFEEDGSGIGSSNLVYVFIFGGGLLIGGIYLLFKAMGGFLKPIRQYARTQGSEEAAMARIERFYNCTPTIDDIKANDEYFMYLGKYGIGFSEAKNVLWVYEHVLTTNYVAKTYTVKVKLANGKCIDIPVARKKQVPDVIQSVVKRVPDVVVGYSEELNAIYSKKRQEMIDEVARRRNVRLGNMGEYRYAEDMVNQSPEDIIGSNNI